MCVRVCVTMMLRDDEDAEMEGGEVLPFAVRDWQKWGEGRGYRGLQ